MIRFIDIRDQETGYRFAFWDTVADAFVHFSGNYAWDTWFEFEDDYESSSKLHGKTERFRELCPEWVIDEIIEKERLIILKKWLTSDCVDDAEELFNEIGLIVALINFWLEKN